MSKYYILYFKLRLFLLIEFNDVTGCVDNLLFFFVFFNYWLFCDFLTKYYVIDWIMSLIKIINK